MSGTKQSREAAYRIVLSLAAARQSKGITQHEVAERMFTSPPTISNLEAGRTNPRLAVLMDYAKAIGVTLEFSTPGYTSDVEP